MNLSGELCSSKGSSSSSISRSQEGTCAEFEVDLVETEQDASELEIQNQASQLREARADSWQLCQMPRALILLAMSLSVAAAAW